MELAKLLGYESEQVFYKWQHRDWYRQLVKSVRAVRILELQQLADQQLEHLLENGGEKVKVAAIQIVYQQVHHQESLAVDNDRPARVAGGDDEFDTLSDDDLRAEEERLARILAERERTQAGAGAPAAGASEAADPDQ